MTREEPELLTDIRDFTSLFCVILKEVLRVAESSIESDLGMRFAMWSLDLAIRGFAFFKNCF